MNPRICAEAIRTEVFRAGDDLLAFIIKHLPVLTENSILAVTSKIVSLSEERLQNKDSVEKMGLIKNEADLFLGEVGYGTALTIKDGLLIPASGIDESNSETGDYILYPKNPYKSAETLCTKIKSHYGLRNFGLIFTDSHTHPLRKGVTGIGLAHWGFSATQDLVGTPDLFGRPLKMTHINVLDALSVMAVLVMGEANERCPLALIKEAPVCFTEKSNPDEIRIPLKDDLYAPLLTKNLNPEIRKP